VCLVDVIFKQKCSMRLFQGVTGMGRKGHFIEGQARGVPFVSQGVEGVGRRGHPVHKGLRVRGEETISLRVGQGMHHLFQKGQRVWGEGAIHFTRS